MPNNLTGLVLEDVEYSRMVSHELLVEIMRLRSMIRTLVSIIESEYPEDDERYQFAMNCLTDVGDGK